MPAQAKEYEYPTAPIHVLPTHWCDYLLNGNASALAEGEETRIADFMRENGLFRALEATPPVKIASNEGNTETDILCSYVQFISNKPLIEA